MIHDANERVLKIDAEGYLLDPDEWDEIAAAQLARQEGVELADEHWRILRFMRSYYEEHQIIPDARFVIKFLAGEMGYEKSAARNRLFTLFPYGYVKQACKIAGMKRPRAWSTG